MKTAEQQIYEMLVENTGQAMCDSGGAYGRNWQRNQDKTLADYENGPEVWLEFYEGLYEFYTISVFHYLTKQLEIDGICEEFNDIPSNGWDDDRMHGVSTKAGQVLDKYNAEILEGFNSCNRESSLSQVIQGTYVKMADNAYVVLQIHGGCDVRGGYTNAKLFKIVGQYNYIPCLAPEDVYGSITPVNADMETPALPGCERIVVSDVIQFSNSYDGYSLRNADNDHEELEIKETDNISIRLSIW